MEDTEADCITQTNKNHLRKLEQFVAEKTLQQKELV
ncbi:hypothetical protein PEDI_24440 [Persicobacter diffluens]|uniref:Uncharacterized protein n=1 Tax=Persicobacter diffluens TaxID=981 RepID=A0AAN4W060_9BACT|nr:hypothetical protein PEDI_24440 [Persicobacter diffluens]